MRQRRLGDPLLRGHTRAAVRALCEHLPDTRSAARHWPDAKARLRRQHMRNRALLPTQQQRVVPSDHNDGAKEVGALPRGSLPGHVVGRGGDLRRGVDRRHQRRSLSHLTQGKRLAAHHVMINPKAHSIPVLTLFAFLFLLTLKMKSFVMLPANMCTRPTTLERFRVWDRLEIENM